MCAVDRSVSYTINKYLELGPLSSGSELHTHSVRNGEMLKTSVLDTYTVISVCTELSLCCVGSTERFSWMSWSWRLKKQMGQEPKLLKIA